MQFSLQISKVTTRTLRFPCQRKTKTRHTHTHTTTTNAISRHKYRKKRVHAAVKYVGKKKNDGATTIIRYFAVSAWTDSEPTDDRTGESWAAQYYRNLNWAASPWTWDAVWEKMINATTFVFGSTRVKGEHLELERGHPCRAPNQFLLGRFPTERISLYLISRRGCLLSSDRACHFFFFKIVTKYLFWCLPAAEVATHTEQNKVKQWFLHHLPR